MTSNKEKRYSNELISVYIHKIIMDFRTVSKNICGRDVWYYRVSVDIVLGGKSLRCAVLQSEHGGQSFGYSAIIRMAFQ